MEILKYQQEIHLNNILKGFWVEKEARSKGEMVALIVSELSEAIEAHRKDIEGRVNWDGFHYLKEKSFVLAFTTFIKNTIPDELADTAIRILDYCKGWDIPIIKREYRKTSTGNFAHDILRLQHYVICAFHEDVAKDWGYVLAAIEAFCQWYGIDLETHIRLKMEYNKTRPYKHNKAY